MRKRRLKRSLRSRAPFRCWLLAALKDGLRAPRARTVRVPTRYLEGIKGRRLGRRLGWTPAVDPRACRSRSASWVFRSRGSWKAAGGQSSCRRCSRPWESWCPSPGNESVAAGPAWRARGSSCPGALSGPGVRLLPTRQAARSRYAAARARGIVPRMRTRFRTLAALLALVAFSASFAEQVWASTCAPAEASRSAQSAPASHAHGGHGGMTTPEDHPDPRIPPPDDAGCPVQAVVAGCTLIFFPPATIHAVPSAPAADARVAPHADPSIPLLLVSSHFRPPQR